MRKILFNNEKTAITFFKVCGQEKPEETSELNWSQHWKKKILKEYLIFLILSSSSQPYLMIPDIGHSILNAFVFSH